MQKLNLHQTLPLEIQILRVTTVGIGSTMLMSFLDQTYSIHGFPTQAGKVGTSVIEEHNLSLSSIPLMELLITWRLNNERILTKRRANVISGSQIIPHQLSSDELTGIPNCLLSVPAVVVERSFQTCMANAMLKSYAKTNVLTIPTQATRSPQSLFQSST